MSVTSCASQGTGTACTNHYEHVTGGSSGDIAHCREGSSGCEAGAVHNCTWSFYMEDLITKHNDSEGKCAEKLLEAKKRLEDVAKRQAKKAMDTAERMARDAAEKAWCATKRATDALVLSRTGGNRQVPMTPPKRS